MRFRRRSRVLSSVDIRVAGRGMSPESAFTAVFYSGAGSVARTRATAAAESGQPGPAAASTAAVDSGTAASSVADVAVSAARAGNSAARPCDVSVGKKYF